MLNISKMADEMATGDMTTEGYETLVSTTANASADMPPPPTITIINGAPRKQNVACDSCRSKKIKCQRNTVQERVRLSVRTDTMRGLMAVRAMCYQGC